MLDDDYDAAVRAVIKKRRANLEAAIAIERMAHWQLKEKPHDQALVEDHHTCVGHVVEEIERILKLRRSCQEVEELRSFALDWIEQTQHQGELPSLHADLAQPRVDQ